VEVCSKTTLHVVVNTEGMMEDAVITLKLKVNNKNSEMKTAVLKEKPMKLRIGNAEAVDTNTGEGLLTTNQQFVIMWLRFSLGGA